MKLSFMDRSTGNQIFMSIFVAMFCTLFIGCHTNGAREELISQMVIGAVCVGIVVAWYGLWICLASVEWSFLAVVSIISLIIFDATGAVVYLFYLLVGLGCIFLFNHMRLSLSHLGDVVLVGLLIASVVVTVDGAYTSFDILSRAHRGDVHQDTLFHVSIAAMLKNYGVISTGLNGLVEMNYHVLSHIVMGAISKLSSKGVLETYGVVQYVFIIPVMMAAIGFHVSSIVRMYGWNILSVFSGLCVLLVFTPQFLNKWGVWNSYFISESFTLSITFFCFGLTILHKFNINKLDVLLVLILTGMMALAKISVAAIYCCLWGGRYLFLSRGWRNIDLWAAAFAGFIFLTIIFGWRDSYGVATNFHFLHFVENYTDYGSKLTEIKLASKVGLGALISVVLVVFGFLIFHFFSTWLVIFMGVCERGGDTRASILYCVGSMLVGVFFLNIAIPGGSAYYFSIVSFFVSLPIILARLSYWYVLSAKVSSICASMRFVLKIFILIWIGINFLTSQKSMVEIQASSAINPLVDKLLVVRSQSRIGQVFEADVDLLATNPVQRCTARPFLFPAISERPWVGVIEDNANCHYEWYGYGRYNYDVGQSRLIPAPVLKGLPLVSGKEILH